MEKKNNKNDLEKTKKTKNLTSEELVAEFYSKGYFDILRKKLLDNFKSSATCEIVNSEVESSTHRLLDENVVSLNMQSSKTIALIEGAINRSKVVEQINTYIETQIMSDDLRNEVEKMLTEIDAVNDNDNDSKHENNSN